MQNTTIFYISSYYSRVCQQAVINYLFLIRYKIDIALFVMPDLNPKVYYIISCILHNIELQILLSYL